MAHKYTNALIEETSPYLLQHAHNPVNWEAWNPKVLERAKKENKPLLISIGYAACHWCHVMEHECFEDEEVAQYMNDNFVNIKIDREERPDVDQIYMDALQMMTGSGGWPLNVITTPDGRPFWGATYLPKDNWLKSLKSLTELYNNDPKKVEEYASNLENGIKQINLYEVKKNSGSFSIDSLNVAVDKWSGFFDSYLGGYKRAPKFPMPNNLDFLLHYAVSENDKTVLEYVNTSLTRMAFGGIYDHVGGGFSRYAVDTKWHVPHFEKMLYDNGQLVSLYAKAYAHTKNPLYKKVVDETIAFVNEELIDDSGGFYSSLDADSENETGELEEGAFYVWKQAELDSLLGKEYAVFADYFNINSYGLWEEGNYVLIRDKSTNEIATKHEISVEQLEKSISNSLSLLKKVRSNRSGPRLDDKILTSWNGLMLQGLVDAYRYLGNEAYLDMALKNAVFLKENLKKPDGGLFRNHKDGRSTINAFLDDYATLIEAYISLYEVTFDMAWLNEAKSLTEYTLEHFLDEDSQLFFYTSDEDEKLIRRSFEVNDNVISASNSIMAKNLLRLHKLFSKEGYGTQAETMLSNVQSNFSENGQGFANWMHLVLFSQKNFYEIAVVGPDYKKMGAELAKNYIPNSILVGTEKEDNLELLQNRFNESQTLIYVCIEGSCKLPVTEIDRALTQL
ncbi:thioredoxin domain-containing protein [Croceivirga thetidis]|uniref:Thioredoxin domain-containing protein n=1 Tax=Croceivirga thetidis TaxID=2721623 RepID=A0ABX1GM12_9FLAO|nr:thioredoxin domain-containing protein [Croceivirga thetidis]NKI30604.1 thioredoxin domain-containing protein [Croceivirga thetidis]